MNLSTMRGILRRRVNERTANKWSDAELDELLNEALKLIQKRYATVDPNVYIEVYTWTLSYAGQVANSGFWELPAGTWRVLEISRLDTTSGKYVSLETRHFDVTRGDLVTGLGGDYPSGLIYSRIGRFLHFAPLLTSSSPSVTLRIIIVGTAAMTDPNDVPPIPLPLHYAIILQAQILAWGESHEDSKPVVEELERQLGDIYTLVDNSGESVRPSIFKKDYR